jgi:hypothetical protein
MRGKITKAAIERLEIGQFLYDSKIRGFVAERTPLELTQLFGRPSDSVEFGFYYKANGRKRWRHLGIYGGTELSVENARTEAKRIADAIKAMAEDIDELYAHIEELEIENVSLWEAADDLRKQLARFAKGGE